MLLKKFQARIKSILFLSLIWDLFFIGISTPGTNLLCFNLLSSTIKSISFLIPKLSAVVALAGAPKPMIFLFWLFNLLIFFKTFFLIL